LTFSVHLRTRFLAEKNLDDHGRPLIESSKKAIKNIDKNQENYESDGIEEEMAQSAQASISKGKLSKKQKSQLNVRIGKTEQGFNDLSIDDTI
jgi:hypothetical protein